MCGNWTSYLQYACVFKFSLASAVNLGADEGLGEVRKGYL